MANLNIPFLIQQGRHLELDIDAEASGLLDDLGRSSVPANRINNNLLLVSDKCNGCFALCHYSSITSRGNQFTVAINPRILCTHSIFSQEEHQLKLMDYCYVKSAAPKILSTSEYLLLTIHKNISGDGGCLRLWNTNDGRCIMTSPQEMFPLTRQPYKIFSLACLNKDDEIHHSHKATSDQQASIVLCVCENNELFCYEC